MQRLFQSSQFICQRIPKNEDLGTRGGDRPSPLFYVAKYQSSKNAYKLLLLIDFNLCLEAPMKPMTTLVTF